MPKIKTPIAPVVLDHPDAPKLAAALEVARGSPSQEELFDIAADIGAYRAFSLVNVFTAAAKVKLFKRIKESKRINDLRVRTATGEVKSFTNMRQLCPEVFGQTYESLLMHEERFDLFSQEAYELAIGLRLNQQALQVIRALPPASLDKVRSAIASNASKPEVLAVIEDLALRVELAEKQSEELRAEAKATGEVLTRKNQRIDKLEMKVNSFETAPPDEQYTVLSDKALSVMRTARAQIDGLLRQACVELKANGDNPAAHDGFLSGLITELEDALGELRLEFNLPVPDAGEEKSWLKAAEEERRKQRAARASKQ